MNTTQGTVCYDTHSEGFVRFIERFTYS